jgi:predicted aldo/keto reductase-like oxidoreductase
METTFDTELKRLQTEYIDYYLMHSLITWEGWQRLKALGVEDFLARKLQSGQIRRIGFSYHGEKEQFKKVIDDYPWDFCQIQYNYMDEHHQAGKEGLEYAASKGLGVVIMEPLRGGTLAGKLPPRIKDIWDSAGLNRTPAEWALRWIWNHPEVTVVLSGMNEEAHIEENIRIAEDARPKSLSGAELKVVDQVKEALSGMMKVGCTGCGYCMPCPAGVNIPLCFAGYNNKHLFNEAIYQIMYLTQTTGTDGGKPSYASLCRNCGQCEQHCPQGLPIRRRLQEVARDMQRFYFKPVASLVRGYYKFRRLMARNR